MELSGDEARLKELYIRSARANTKTEGDRSIVTIQFPEANGSLQLVYTFDQDRLAKIERLFNSKLDVSNQITERDSDSGLPSRVSWTTFDNGAPVEAGEYKYTPLPPLTAAAIEKLFSLEEEYPRGMTLLDNLQKRRIKIASEPDRPASMLSHFDEVYPGGAAAAYKRVGF